MAESESVSSDYSSDEETGLKAMATKINLQAFLPDNVENGQVCKFEVQAEFRMTRFMEKMFSISSLEASGARVIISPEGSGDRQILRFMVSLSPGTKVEVKFQGQHVAGSPYTYHALAPSVQALDEAEATDGPSRMELLQDLESAIAEKNVTTANNEVEKKANTAETKMVNKEAPSTTARPSAPVVVDLSSDSSTSASARGIDFSAGFRWSEVGFIDERELGGQVGLCLLKNGNLVVSTMENKVTKKSQVKRFDPQLKFIKKILDKDDQEFSRPGDMTRLYNGDFALKDESGIQVFNPRGLFESRIWTSPKPWRCFGLAEDEEKRLWFIYVHMRTKETHLNCYDPKKQESVRTISLKQLVGDRLGESMCRFLTFWKGKLYISDLGLNQVFILDPNNFESVGGIRSSGARDGQLNYPAGVAVDDVGNILVADCRNNRLSLYDKKGKWIKNLKDRRDGVDRPSDILLDRERRELYCLNLSGRKAVVKYRAEPVS